MRDCYDSLAEAAKDALDSQFACNLSGVVHAMARAATTLWNEVNLTGKGDSYWVNQHPIMRLFATQVLFLTFGESVNMMEYSKSHEACIKIAGGVAFE